MGKGFESAFELSATDELCGGLEAEFLLEALCVCDVCERSGSRGLSSVCVEALGVISGLEIGVGCGFTESLVSEGIGEGMEDIAFLDGVEGGECEGVFVPACGLTEGKGGFSVTGGLECVAECAGVVACVREMDGESFDVGCVFDGEFVGEFVVDLLEPSGVVLCKDGKEDIADAFVVKVDLIVFLGITKSDHVLEAKLTEVGCGEGEIECAQE